MTRTIQIIIFLLVLTNSGYSQNIPTKQDSVQIDSMMIMLEKLAREWNPQDELWTFISIELKDLNLIIKYGQQSIHPFLAEYNRKIQFLTETHSSDTLDMAINSGGRTLIEIYYDKGKKLLIMEDTFGKYFYDLTTQSYYEKLYNFEPYENKEYIGRINGKEYPLKFEQKEK